MHPSKITSACLFFLANFSSASQHAKHHNHLHARREDGNLRGEPYVSTHSSLAPSGLAENLGYTYADMSLDEENSVNMAEDPTYKPWAKRDIFEATAAVTALVPGAEQDVESDSDNSSESDWSESDGDSDDDIDPYATDFSAGPTSSIPITSTDTVSGLIALDRRAAFGAAVQHWASSWNLPGKLYVTPSPTATSIAASGASGGADAFEDGSLDSEPDDSDSGSDSNGTVSGSDSDTDSDTDEYDATVVSSTVSTTSEPILTRVLSLVRRTVGTSISAPSNTDSPTSAASLESDSTDSDSDSDSFTDSDTEGGSDSDYTTDDDGDDDEGNGMPAVSSQSL